MNLEDLPVLNYDKFGLETYNPLAILEIKLGSESKLYYIAGRDKNGNLITSESLIYSRLLNPRLIKTFKFEEYTLYSYKHIIK